VEAEARRQRGHNHAASISGSGVAKAKKNDIVSIVNISSYMVTFAFFEGDTAASRAERA